MRAIASFPGSDFHLRVLLGAWVHFKLVVFVGLVPIRANPKTLTLWKWTATSSDNYHFAKRAIFNWIKFLRTTMLEKVQDTRITCTGWLFLIRVRHSVITVFKNTLLYHWLLSKSVFLNAWKFLFNAVLAHLVDLPNAQKWIKWRICNGLLCKEWLYFCCKMSTKKSAESRWSRLVSCQSSRRWCRHWWSEKNPI